MQGLPITDHHIASTADKRHRTFQSLTIGVADQRFDIELSETMAAGKNPDTVHRSTSVELCHEIETVDPFVKIWAIPMCDTVLMPGNSSPNTWLFDKQRFVEGSEVFAINGFCNPE